MGYKNREIEKKFVAPETNLETAFDLLKNILGECEILSDASRDHYWNTPKGLKADFIRLRNLPNGTAELTLKHADQGGNTNRVEIDVPCDDPAQAKAFLEHLIGPPDGSVYKEYHVFFLDKRDTTVSVYRVRSDKRIFVEVEARTLDRVEKIQEQLKELNLISEKRSLYQIFIQKKGE